MADDKSKTGGQDRQRINTGQDYEVQDWARKASLFGLREGEFAAQGAIRPTSRREARARV